MCETSPLMMTADSAEMRMREVGAQTVATRVPKPPYLRSMREGFFTVAILHCLSTYFLFLIAQ